MITSDRSNAQTAQNTTPTAVEQLEPEVSVNETPNIINMSVL